MTTFDRPVTGKRLLAGDPLGIRRSQTVPAAAYPNGSYTFTATRTGKYKFVMWGAGGGTGGGSGAHIQAERFLTNGQRVAIVVGKGATGDGGATTVTLPSGEVLTAGGGLALANGGTGGTATAKALDVAINGSQANSGTDGSAGGGNAGGAGGAGGGGNTGGAGAPGQGLFRGGEGGSAAASPGSPGAGGVLSGTTDAGADGSVIVFLSRF